ncbi:MAG: TonB-dependent receptor domain-containing protein, partial [Gemmatimonadaceae bacterium]
ALSPQRAWQYEVGARDGAGLLQWELSLYDIELRDELLNQNVQPFPGAPFTVPTYRNAPRTRHAGIEAGLALLCGSVSGRASYAFNRFTFVNDPQFRDNDLPGAPSHYLAAEATWTHRAGLSLTPTIEWSPSRYHVNSANSDTNEPWAALGARVDWSVERAGATVFLHARNLTDARYSASVQVDNAVGRYFEPADSRSFYVGMRWSR